MVYGHPTQSLRLGCIPEGLRMYITDIHFSVPAGNHEWKANFRELSSTMNAIQLEQKKKELFPLEVSPDIDKGHIGKVSLYSTSVVDSGDGPSAKIDFVISGDATMKGKSVAIGQKGIIEVSTGVWGGLFSLYSNPSNMIVKYELVDSGFAKIENPLPFARDTKELVMMLKIAEDKGKEVLAMKVDSMVNPITAVIDIALWGIFQAHKGAVGWVFGEVEK